MLLFPFINRYLHKNIKQTNERRGEVKKLKEQLAALQQKLEWWVNTLCLRKSAENFPTFRKPVSSVVRVFERLHSYRNYGSGPIKYPLADMLQFVLEFATTKPSSLPPAEDLRPNSSSPTPCSQPLSENDVHINNRLDVLLKSRSLILLTASLNLRISSFASSLVFTSLLSSVHLKTPIPQTVSYPVASGRQYTSPSHSADPRLTARHCRPRTASVTRSCTR